LHGVVFINQRVVQTGLICEQVQTIHWNDLFQKKLLFTNLHHLCCSTS